VSKTPRDKDAAVEKLSFEQALAEIESIIEQIEGGEVGLEDSLRQYERGVALVNHCRGKLDRAQQQVEDLTRRLEQTDEEGEEGNAADATQEDAEP
jgi:exodeoxyribonuclease VII small subunit